MNPPRNLLHLAFVFVSMATSGVVHGSEPTGWVQRFLPPAGEDLLDVHYGNGVWVFAGDEGALFRSTDGGVTQSSVTVSTSSNIFVVHYGGNVWLAGDVSGSVWRSTDAGLTWTSISISGFSYIRGIHYANGTWMLVGPSGKIFRSLDEGLSWTEMTTPTSEFLFAISYAEGVWIATGADRTVLRSTDDGLTWAEIDVSSELLSGVPLYDVDSDGSGTWIAGGGVNSGAVIKSSDGGLTWSSRDVGGSKLIRAIEFADNEWRAVGSSGTLITSLDNGENWSLDQPTNVPLNGVAWGDDRWLIAGDTNTLLGSDDGITFSLLTSRKSEDLFGISHDGDSLTAVGAAGSIVRSFDNGSTWHDRSLTGFLEDFYSIVDNESSSWAAVGGSGSSEMTLITNSDFASSGTNRTTPGVPLYDIGLGGTTLVAVGHSGSIRRYKGQFFNDAWSHPVSGTTQSLNTVAAGNGVWIAAGDQGIVIASLDDGQTWASRTSNTSASLRGIAYDPLEACWLAVGENGILIQSEDDGVTWTSGQTSTSETLENVVYGNGASIAMGANGTLLYSTDHGVSWSPQSLGVAVTLHDATYRDGEWWVVGDEGTIYQSAVDSPQLSVEQPADSVLTNDQSTVDFGSVLVASSAQRVFTIRNTGTADLTGFSISIDGSHADEFSAGSPAAATLAPGESTTFAVSFTPSAQLSRSASLHVSSNNSDGNPFDISLSGRGIDPRIAVDQPVGNRLSDGVSVVDFGGTSIGNSVDRVFRIRSSGTATLTGLTASLSGPDKDDFSVGTISPTTLTTGSSTTLTVTFTPGANGAKTANLQIFSNVRNESPFDIDLSGAGGFPEIAVENSESALVDNEGTLQFPDVFSGGAGSADLILTIRNTGVAPLTGLSASIEGTDQSSFSAGAFGETSLAPAASTPVTISFNPTIAGNKDATLKINSNDADENPFDINLAGTLIESTTLSTWASAYGLSGAAALPDADDDGDSVSLIEEYAWNLDPTNFDQDILVPGVGTSGRPSIQIVNDRLRIEYLRRRSDPDLTYEAQFGSTLADGGFLSAPEQSETVTIIDLNFERVVVEDSESASTATLRFGRLRLIH